MLAWAVPALKPRMEPLNVRAAGRSGAAVIVIGFQRHAAGYLGRLAQDQLLQDRARTRPLPPAPRRRSLRMRPLPDLREVRHHTRIRTTTARTARGRADPRPRRGRTRLGPRGRTPPLHQRAHRETPGRPRPTGQRTPRCIGDMINLNCPHKVLPGLRARPPARHRPAAADPELPGPHLPPPRSPGALPACRRAVLR